MDAHPADDIPSELQALVKAFKLMQSAAWSRLGPLGLYPGQDRLLAELWAEDGITQTELARRLGVELPTVTKAAQRLERGGLIRRERAARDQRQMLVSLTDSGRAVRAPVEQVWQEVQETMLRGLSPADRVRLVDLLSQIITNLSPPHPDARPARPPAPRPAPAPGAVSER